MLPPHTTAAQLSLPPALLWGGDILQPEPRVLLSSKSPPMSRSLEILPAAAAVRYHAAWSFGGGCFCNVLHWEKERRTKVQRGKYSYSLLMKTNTQTKPTKHENETKTVLNGEIQTQNRK